MLIVCLKGLCFMAGLVCVYAAFFIREDEEGKLQNAVETLWVVLDDRGGMAISRNTAFLREQITSMSFSFDRMFRKRGISLRSIVVGLSILSASFCSELPSISFVTTYVSMLIFMNFAVLGITVESRYALGLLVVPNLFIPAVVFWNIPRGSVNIISLLLLGYVVGIASGIFLISADRFALKWSAEAISNWRVAVVLSLNILLAVLLIGPRVWLVGKIGLLDRHVLLLAISASTVVGGGALSVAALLALVLGHRLTWPLISHRATVSG